MDHRKPLLLYFHVGHSTFVKKDIEILQGDFEIKSFNFISISKWKTPLLFMHQFFFIILNLFRSKLFVCQLSGYHSFLPALTSKFSSVSCLIVASGTDCHSFPSIGYGNYQKVLLGWFTKMSFRLCNHIAPKHHSLVESSYTYSSNDPALQGYLAFDRKLNKPFTVITNGYDPDLYIPSKKIKNQFITASGNLNQSYQYKLKGIDLIIEIASKFPECNFIIAGAELKLPFSTEHNNIRLVPKLKNEELLKLFSESEYYLQLSMAEGFPNALCEAMLCGCVPIGSCVFSIPEIIGNTGFILDHRSASELESLIRKAINSENKEYGIDARKRIINMYPLSSRKEKLIKLCKDLI